MSGNWAEVTLDGVTESMEYDGSTDVLTLEDNGVYLVLELAPEGELFNWIVMKQKLTEDEARKVFVQLFQAVKYLVS